jgi:sugar lactone lactonase YvrE
MKVGQEGVSREVPETGRSQPLGRRALLGWLGLAAVGQSLGCAPPEVDPKQQVPGAVTYGRRGISDGRFLKPRGIAIDAEDRIYIVDMTGRIQVFSAEGEHQRTWNTPSIEQGKPTGISVGSDGMVMVADTHYFRILFYTPEGRLEESRTIGGTLGKGPGQFGFVTDVLEDPEGHLLVSNYGDTDRVQKFDRKGKWLGEFGLHGEGPLEFSRPQSMAIDRRGRLWVSDACNHRLQVIDFRGDRPQLLAMHGSVGDEAGRFRYPYGLCADGDRMLVVEYGNHRVQAIDLEGRSLGFFGGPGDQLGQLNQPWSMVVDQKGRWHILDSLNHRVQRWPSPV